jgi:hypothetical protein
MNAFTLALSHLYHPFSTATFLSFLSYRVAFKCKMWLSGQPLAQQFGQCLQAGIFHHNVVMAARNG